MISNQIVEGPCKTLGWRKEMCLKKSEVGRFASFMQAGDPCFLKDDGKRVIFLLIYDLIMNIFSYLNRFLSFHIFLNKYILSGVLYLKRVI